MALATATTRRAGAGLLVLTALAAACGPMVSDGRAFRLGARNPGVVQYRIEPSAIAPDIAQDLQGRFEATADLLNRAFWIPHDLTIEYRDCDKENAYYSRDDHAVTVCYGLVDLFRKAYPDSSPYLLALFIEFHELAHALVHMYDLPIVGRDEDAADQFAALYLIEGARNVPQAISGVILAAQFFQDSAATVDGDPDFWDGHSFGDARRAALLCMVYGGLEESRPALEDVIPPERAEECPAEYAEVRRNWNRLLAPYSRVENQVFFGE